MSSLLNVDGALIKNLRERRGLTQQELAALSCLSVRQIKQIEEGGASTSFYNDDIKRKAMLKLAVMLDAPHSHSLPPVAADAPTASDAPAMFRAETLHPLANPPESSEASDPTEDLAPSTSPPPRADEPVHALTTNEPVVEAEVSSLASRRLLVFAVVLAIVSVAYGLSLFTFN